jgi:hypothetical protein
MYYPLLCTCTCTAVLPVLCLGMYGCAIYAVLRSVLYRYVQLCRMLGCVRMYGLGACAVPVPVCTAVLCVGLVQRCVYFMVCKGVLWP